MGSVKIRYYVVKKGRGYWVPTKAMRAAGFQIVRCGPDGPPAWRIASEWAFKWAQYRRSGALPLKLQPRAVKDPDAIFSARYYPPQSLGEAFQRYRKTAEWRKKAPRTREDWDRAWRWIDPVLGDVSPSTVTLEVISGLRETVEAKVSLREAHRVIKVWRALWNVAASMKYCEGQDPSLAVRNSAAKGRTAVWTEGEAVRLVKAAWRSGFKGLAAALAVMWDSQLSPADVRALVAGQIRTVLAGGTTMTERQKTGKRAGAALSKRSAAILRAYVDSLGVEMLDDALVFRTRGHASAGRRRWMPQPYTKDLLSKDFRVVRALVFGDGEDRKMLDFRRSGAAEAIAGDAEAEHLAHAMGNTLSQSNALFETYAPAAISSVRKVMAARKRGRVVLRDENEK